MAHRAYALCARWPVRPWFQQWSVQCSRFRPFWQRRCKGTCDWPDWLSTCQSKCSSTNDDVGHARRQMSLKKIQTQTDGSSNAKGLFHQRSCLQIHMKRFVIRQMWKCTFEAFESVDMKPKYETEALNIWIWNANMKYLHLNIWIWNANLKSRI